MSMHIDYAKEVVEYHEDNFDDYNKTILKSLAAEAEILSVAELCSDEKIRSICKTIRDAENDRYKKVTDKQRYAIATFLLEQFGTARAVLAKAFNTTEEEMFGKEVEIIEGIEIHPSLNVAYGKLSDFIADAEKQKLGKTYKASKAAIRTTNSGRTSTLLVKMGEEIIAVSLAEFEKLGKPEVNGEWYDENLTSGLQSVAKTFRRALDEQ